MSHPTAPIELQAFLELLDELLDNGRYAWAHDTLAGIRTTVTARREVTAGQRLAVARIAAARRRADDHDGLPSQRHGGSRRYEGWEPGR